ncbi:hypothetical protein AGLY_005666 [Aphis glycines]|uniref:Glycosyl hydrolase family 13 catalytic domain-containing protein n=1 Tax=Aphis glycines TaxID=307491 RepID=A0A6G0TVT2_APHGL|nr:hypothetical protein AGLY_005666 [Aphis glycines]
MVRPIILPLILLLQYFTAQILQIKNSVFTQAANNIKKSKIKQKKAYNTRHSNKPNFKIGNLVLLRNCIRDDRKDRYISDADKPIVAIEEPNLKISAETIQSQDNKIHGSKFRFHPINNKWQKEQCKIMNLAYVQNDYFKMTRNSILHFPNVCASTIPDVYENHNKKVDDFSNTQNYITKSNMESDKVWATEVKMHFTAAFLSADINSFTANQWLQFSHSLQLSTKPDYNKMAIYLKHKNSNHFEVVLKVKKIAGFDKQWNEIRQQYYLHQFFIQQPDLNFWNPLVRKDIKNILCFWLDKGVDGFRMDAVSHIYEKFMAIETYLVFKYSKKFYGNDTNPGVSFPLNSCFLHQSICLQKNMLIR